MADNTVEREALALFEQSLDLPEAEREAWLAARTAGRPHVAARIAAMMTADRSVRMRTGGAVDEVDEEEMPERVGAYRITELIGRGGMGSVYRGERASGDFAHVAAIKIVKPGLLSEALVERFQRERALLARLTHPNIAQLHDGGETETGSPYIVMEFVDGEPVLSWIKARSPDKATRLRIFADICAAVAFAHRSLIVHRDLTPSNVLVTADGVVKVIDFGIAKMVDAAPGDVKPSSLSGLSFTPGFAAPERMTSPEITTAADIYSLGKLLERILPPADSDHELLAIIRKATAHDPRARYASADALGADVAAWSRHYPVSAVKPTRGYMLRKFVRRNLGVVIATAAVIAVLSGALLLTREAYLRAEDARQAEAERFQDLRELAHFMLFDLNASMARVAGNTGPRIELAGEAQRYLGFLALSSRADNGLLLEAAQGFVELARIQGVPQQPNLGETEAARDNLKIAERALATMSEQSPDARATLARARGMQALILYHVDAKQDEARAMLDDAQAILDAVAKPERTRVWLEAQRDVRKVALDLADRSNRHADIAPIAKALEDDIRAWPKDMPPLAADLDRAVAIYYRGLADSMGGESETYGVPLFLDAETKFDALEAANRNEPMVLYMAARNAYMGFAAASKAGQEDVSNRLILKARDIVERLLTIEERDDALRSFSSNIKEALAQNLRDQDKFAEAIALEREVVAQRRERAARDTRSKATSDLAFSLMILGLIARDSGDRDLTCESWREAEALFLGLKAKGELLGFHESFLAGLRRSLEKCDAGAPLSDFGPLRE